MWYPVPAVCVLHPDNAIVFDRRTHSSVPPTGHESDVASLVASSNGRFFASCSSDTTIILWDAVRGGILHEWQGHSGRRVNTLAFSPDGAHLLSGGDDNTLKVWDVSSPVGQEVPVKHTHTLLASDGRMPDPGQNIFRCLWSADGKWLVSLSITKTLRVWAAPNDKLNPTSSFRLHRTFHEDALSPLLCPPVFSPDSRWLVWHSERPGEYFCAWDATAPDSDGEADAPPRRFPAAPGEELTSTPSFDPSGARIVTVSERVMRVWDIATGVQLAVMKGHAGDIAQVSWSPDGRRVLSASRDGTARVWCAESGACELTLHPSKEERGETVRGAIFSPNGGHIATKSLDATVRLWSAADGTCVATFRDHEVPVERMVFSPDGTRLASGDEEGVVRIRDISGIVGRSAVVV